MTPPVIDADRLERALHPLLADVDRDPAALDALVAEHLLGWHRRLLPEGGEVWGEPLAHAATVPRTLAAGDRWWSARIEFAWELVDALARDEGMVAFELRRGLVKARPWRAAFESLLTANEAEDGRANRPHAHGHADGGEDGGEDAGAASTSAAVAVVAAALRLAVADPTLVAVLVADARARRVPRAGTGPRDLGAT